ncbi:hypothetical protein SAMN05216436_1182 [bacterium A37T11]|nr:hypothetical protein SAMN05216436_1182 [bacterium A37T11]
MQIGRLMLFLLFLQVTPVYSQDKTFTAQVVRIIDGDTMEVLYQKNTNKGTPGSYRQSRKKRVATLWKPGKTSLI